MEKATIHDYARMCNSYDVCNECPLHYRNCGIEKECDNIIIDEPDKANEIILKWCKEHPVETRQSRFLKMFPNAPEDKNGIIAVSPCTLEKNYAISNCSKNSCTQCRKEYWLAEVEEHDK